MPQTKSEYSNKSDSAFENDDGLSFFDYSHSIDPKKSALRFTLGISENFKNNKIGPMCGAQNMVGYSQHPKNRFKTLHDASNAESVR